MPKNEKKINQALNHLDTTMDDIKPHKQSVKLISEKVRDLNRSEARLQKSRIDYYKNHHGSNILIPTTKRLNWNIQNTLEAALNPSRGKRREFRDGYAKHTNESSHFGEIYQQLPDVG